jgi:predicted extracellular nuclease
LVLGCAVALALLVGAAPAAAMTSTSSSGTPSIATSSELYFSEYIEGSSNNKALEIYNGTGASINLGANAYSVQMFFNGAATAGLTINLSGSVADGDVFVLAQSSASAAILAQADQTNGAGWFNGDDAVVLRKGATIIDVIGQIGSDPGTEWGTGLTSTADNTLRRKDSITAGDTNGADSFDPAVEWDGFATDTFNGLGVRSGVVVPSLAINDVSASEGDSGGTLFNFTVSLSSPAGAAGVTFDIATADGSATAPGDYVANSLTGQTIAAGGLSYTFTVTVNGDTSVEPNKAFFVNVTNVTGATVADAHGQGTILDDDVDTCPLPYTPIYAIQGSSPAAATTGPVVTEGVVVGDYEGASPALRGFYLQDATGDGDASTSDGIFVFDGNNDSVDVGDVVRVTGNSAEFQDQTQISASNIVGCGSGSVAPTDVTLPFATASFPERYEGMLVRMHQTLYVTEHFQLGRFGEVLMSSGGRLQQPTNVAAPGAPAAALQAQNDLNKILMDDTLQNQNSDPILFGRFGDPLTASNTLRGGDTATDVVGVMTYTWAGNAASGNAFRVRPIGALGGGVPSFQPTNPRPAAAPSVGGSVRVVGMNLLNFFNTFSGCTNGVGGAATDCRGADSQAEFDRQWPKTVAAIRAMNPDVLGVNELENDGYGSASAIQFLVDRLNEATAPGTYAFIDADAATGQVNALGTDAIKVSMLYKPAAVTPVGQTAVLNSVAFVNGGDSFPRSRPSLAQAFQVNATGARFIVDDNHLKSKGSACDAPDAGDGQGNCNKVRVNAATQLTNWLASNPTGTGDPDILLVGDYNSYAMEDPITVIRNAGFANLVSEFDGPDAYSYVFDGQWGYLDHALGSASLVPQVAGVGDFHINSDEPSVLDYNTDFKTPHLISSLYAPDQFRVSDHDPVVIGLNPNAPPTANAGGPYSVGEGASVTLSATGSDPNSDTLSYAWDVDDNGSFETAGQTATFSASGLDGPSSRTVEVQVSDGRGLSDVSSAAVNVVNVAPSATFAATPSSVFAGYSFTLSLTGATDPSPADTAAGFTYAFDCGSGYGAFGASSTSSCSTSTTGTLAVGAKIRDRDGDSREYTSTVGVTVTYSSLCSLTRDLVTKQDVEDSLCVMLDQASRASAAGDTKKRDGALKNYRQLLDAQSGKSVTAANAALLKSLSVQLP